MPPLKYKVIWGDTNEQRDLSKSQALFLAGKLLENYNNVSIQSYYK